MAKRLGKAFLTGGVIGVVGQILIKIAGLIVDDPMMAMMLGILLFGFVGVILIISGFYFKVAKFGADAAAIPVCGLMFGAAMGAASAKKTGMSSGKAFLAGFWGVIRILGTGFIIALILGLLLK